MHAEHNSVQQSAVSHQQSEKGSQRPSESNPQERDAVSGFQKKTNSRDFTNSNDGTGAPAEHACPLNRTCRGECLAWDDRELPAALRWFAENHRWHDPGIYTNKRILRRVFAKPIAKAVSATTCAGKTTLAAQIQADFVRLQETTRSLDRMCIRRIDEDDEEVVFEHSKEQLKRMIAEIARLVESKTTDEADNTDLTPRNTQISRKIVEVPSAEALGPTPSPLRGTPPSQGESESWVTVTAAAKMLNKNRGTISHWAKIGKVRDNGKTGRRRRVAKTDILLIKQAAEEKDLQNDLDELRRDAKRIK